MIHLSKHQLFTLMFIYEVGSTTLFALGIKVNQDAWIAILIALLIGLGFVWIYTELQNAFPDKNYAEIILAILGNKLGIPFILITTLGFMWHCARNLREFGELIIITSLPEVPLWLIIFIFICISIYSLIKGVEVLARASEIITPILILFMLSIYLFVYISGNMDLKKLTPILSTGLKPIAKIEPSLVMFPYGEMFVFLMFWNYAREKNLVRKTAMSAVFWSGILLCCSVVMEIAVLGPKYTSIATIPLVETIRTINIGNIITNIDAIGIIIIFFGGFFKATVYLYGIISILSTLFKLKHYNLITILAGLFMWWVSVKFEPSYAFHQWMYPFDANNYAIYYCNIMPLLLLLIFYIKKGRTQF